MHVCNNKPVKIQLYFNSIFLLTHILLYKPSTAAGDLSLQLHSSTQEPVKLSQVSGHKMSANGYQRFKFSLTIISTAPADGLAPVGARPSAGAVMTIRVSEWISSMDFFGNQRMTMRGHSKHCDPYANLSGPRQDSGIRWTCNKPHQLWLSQYRQDSLTIYTGS